MKKRDIIETHPRGIQQQTSVSIPELTDSEADRQRILFGESFHFSAKI